MAANIEQFQDGTAAFFSAREVAWHKLGTVTDSAKTAQEALKIAQLDWEVKKSEVPVQTIVPTWNTEVGTTLITKSDKFITYRYHPKTHSPEALGVVGNRYTPVQNLEAFEFLNAVSDESGAVFETAGALGKGQQVFMTMKMPKDILIGGHDAVNLYLLAWNTHDGTSSFKVVVTPTRVVCQNTLQMALGNAKRTFSLRHTSGVTGKVQQARETLDLSWKYVSEFEKEANSLISTKMSDAEFKKFMEKLLPEVKEEGKRDRSEEAREVIGALWTAPTQQNILKTRWAAFNSVAEYVDWASPIRGKDQALGRAIRNITGKNQNLKVKALSLLK
jgi:phage/plasmid-like protein (TIGR03299 family)